MYTRYDQGEARNQITRRKEGSNKTFELQRFM